MSRRESGITAVVITRNEERNIGPCLQSLAWADEVIVVDACSTDGTAEIARSFTPKVIVRPWDGYGNAKNAGIETATHAWILSVDADERVPEGLAAEISRIVRADHGGPRVFEVARRAYFLGKWIRHAGWYPGYVPRLFRKGTARYDTARVHEALLFEGPTGRLRHDLEHYTDDIMFHYIHKLNAYTSLASDDLLERKRRFRISDLILRPAFQFFKMYVVRLGILDGMPGLILSLFSGSYVFVKYAKLREAEGKTPH